ncbi:hypothetical protein H4R35_005063 [Dimargaris xerosporica]|nr:hypothetical protein H4R35_005063 [Dimargaris xerosporica]
MTSTLTPATRPESIDHLLNSVERYNPANTEVLEDYLNTQCQNDENDLAANLALLKLYQFNPPLFNPSAVAKVLIKALINFFEADFNLCLYLLNEIVAAEPVIVALLELKQCLDEARFADFWATLRTHQAKAADSALAQLIAEEVKDFDRSMQRTIAEAIAMAYQTIDLSLVSQYFNLEGAALQQFIAELGWTMDDSQVVHIPLNKANEVKPTVINESIQFSQLTKIIGHASTA